MKKAILLIIACAALLTACDGGSLGNPSGAASEALENAQNSMSEARESRVSELFEKYEDGAAADEAEGTTLPDMDELN